MIYFIGTNNGLVNIGRGRNIHKTLYIMRKYCTDPTMEFKVVGTMNGDDEILKQIQDVFQDFHSHREWYKSTDFVRRSIENLIKS